MPHHRPSAFLSLLVFFTGLTAQAGEVQVSWGVTPSAMGYKVYRGTTSGGYSEVTDVGQTTATVAGGLTDCMPWYFAVTAYNSAGESGFSSEVSSWPRAVPGSAVPTEIETGTQAILTITGTNFQPGDLISFSNSGLQLNSVEVASCSTLNLDVTVAADAALGPVTLTVTHPNGVAGTAIGLFAVNEPSAQVPLPPTNVVVD